jgi:diguanylate cyclase (GGDEF)-like protein
LAAALLAVALYAAAWLAPVEARPAAALLGCVLATAVGGRAGGVAAALASLTLPVSGPLRIGLAVAALANGELHERRRSTSRALTARSFTDRLTGLRNYDFFAEAMRAEVARVRRYGGCVTLVLIDLDRFKAFNDRHGHQAGDLLLKEATAAWKSMLRAEDLLVRYGGEEFCVLMAGSPADAALELVERLRTATPRRQSFSAGIAQWDGRETPEQLLARADAALYEAKRSGRDRVVSSPAPAATS